MFVFDFLLDTTICVIIIINSFIDHFFLKVKTIVYLYTFKLFKVFII